ncbi:MAG: AIPR family protein [Ignavibacteriales bacterium]|nr:AIPR family protein [Ignavibacteriales bacterium]
MSQYQTLVNILDEIRKEAPSLYKSYYPLETELEKRNLALSKCYIHLFLKVKFGLLDFTKREEFITDGPFDGGIDAYYIDSINRMIYIIQSKFRMSKQNFEEKTISIDELLSMDVNRVTDGLDVDEQGNKYNSKIISLIEKIQKIADISRYKYEVILLANLKNYTTTQINKVIAGFPVQIFSFEKCYEELVFPVVSGSYYYSKNLIININLTNKEISSSKIRYPVKAKSIECEISVLFVPTLEIAEKFSCLKNSILKYNPRSYLGLLRNPVNANISRTISESTYNEFALYNNGITILSDNTYFQEKVGKIGKGQLSLENPQIINGAQTAYTLSAVYENAVKNNLDVEALFNDKEVMLKVITFPDKENMNETLLLELITEISRATNLQTAVKEADRRANDPIQLELQKQLFQKFGYFYERKKGEFYDGIKNHYISKDKIINRQIFLRVLYTLDGNPALASRVSERFLFKKEALPVLIKLDQIEQIFFAYKCTLYLREIRKTFDRQENNRFGVVHFGNALENGIFAVVYVVSKTNTDISQKNINEFEKRCLAVLKRWLEFEEYVKVQKRNSAYFRKLIDSKTGIESIETEFNKYYRSDTLMADLNDFFNIK